MYKLGTLHLMVSKIMAVFTLKTKSHARDNNILLVPCANVVNNSIMLC